MAYTTKAKIESYTGETIDSTLATMVISWVTDWINRYTGRNFEPATESRYYDLTSGYDVNVDVFTGTPSEVSVLDNEGNVERTLVEGSDDDYVLLPFNELNKYTIRLNRGSSVSHFPYRGRSLKVTADFGYSGGVPPVIEMVATKLAAGLTTDLVGREITSQSLGDYSVSYAQVDETAREMGVNSSLDMYRDIEI